MANSDDTILPPRRPINSGGLDGDTVLPGSTPVSGHAVGDVIHNRYTVVREIGRGGMGVVYEVLDAITGDHYAIKRLLPEYIARPDIVELFRTEGAASMRFTNKSQRFVTTQMVDIEGGIPYIVLQLIRLPTLRVVMQQAGGHLSVAVALPVLLEVATALKELHGFGYVHRDLKPENIFVDTTLTPPAVLLVDFGLSKDACDATRTVMRGAGTERYASPEQVKGEATTPATDVFAFGVIAYEALTGELPRFGETLTDYVSAAAPELVRLVTACLAGKAEKRPQNGDQLVSQFATLMVTRDESEKPSLKVVKHAPKQPEPQPVKPTVVRTTLSFEGVQDGAIVEVDKTTLVKPFVYNVDIETSARQGVSVLIRWQDQVVFEKQITLVAGINQTLKVPEAYRIECAVPAWCSVKDVNRKDVRFPVKGLLINSSDVISYTLVHDGAEFGKLSITPKPGANGLPFQYGLGTLTFDDVPSGCRVLVNGTEKGSAYTVPIVIGVPASLSVRVQDQNRVEVYRENVTLEASESMSLGGISEKIRLTPETDVNKLGNAKSESINKTEVESTESSMKDSVTESVSSKFEQRHNNPFLREYLIKVAFAFSGALSFLLADSFFKKFWITYCENLVSSGEAGKYDAYKGVSEQLLADKTLFALQNLPKIRMDDPHILSNILHGNLINISVFLLCCSAIVWILYKWKN